MISLKNFCLDFWRLIFPRVCACCGNYLVQGEDTVCLDCWYDFPRTQYHLQPNNPIEQLFWGRVPIEQATAWCFYTKGGKMQTLLHALKYKSCPSVGLYLGRQMALELGSWLQVVEALIPVPLHPKKLRLRGYNQSEQIAAGLSAISHLPVYADALQRVHANLTQTHKGVYERWENAQGLFALNTSVYPASFWQNKNVLLIDDVITTGATAEACAEVLVQVGARVSILSVAAALPDNF